MTQEPTAEGQSIPSSVDPDASPSREDMADYEAQLDDIDTKALLVEQNALLRAIYAELVPDEPDHTELWECKQCNAVVDDRLGHLQQDHKAPLDTDINPDRFFTRA